MSVISMSWRGGNAHGELLRRPPHPPSIQPRPHARSTQAHTHHCIKLSVSMVGQPLPFPSLGSPAARQQKQGSSPSLPLPLQAEGVPCRSSDRGRATRVCQTDRRWAFLRITNPLTVDSARGADVSGREWRWSLSKSKKTGNVFLATSMAPWRRLCSISNTSL